MVIVSKFATTGSGWGQLSNPCSVSTDSYGFILVVERGDHRKSVFDKDGS